MGVERIVFTGGEPLMYNRLPELVDLTTKLGISGNIKENSLIEMYNSEYFSNIRKFNTGNSCSFCKQYSICKSGCIGQKIIANYADSEDKVLTLKRCINTRDPKCVR